MTSQNTPLSEEVAEEEAKRLIHDARQSLLEFRAGREESCRDIIPRLEAGDGRRLRSRRIAAHVRGCARCQAVHPP